MNTNECQPITSKKNSFFSLLLTAINLNGWNNIGCVGSYVYRLSSIFPITYYESELHLYPTIHISRFPLRHCGILSAVVWWWCRQSFRLSLSLSSPLLRWHSLILMCKCDAKRAQRRHISNEGKIKIQTANMLFRASIVRGNVKVVTTERVNFGTHWLQFHMYIFVVFATSHFSTDKLLAASWSLSTSHTLRCVFFYWYIFGAIETKLSPFVLSLIQFNLSNFHKYDLVSYGNVWIRCSLAKNVNAKSNLKIASRIFSKMCLRCLPHCIWAISLRAIIVIKAALLCVSLAVVNSFHSLRFCSNSHAKGNIFHWTLLRLASFSFSTRWAPFIYLYNQRTKLQSLAHNAADREFVGRKKEKHNKEKATMK